jgi:hypothetical protein
MATSQLSQTVADRALLSNALLTQRQPRQVRAIAGGNYTSLLNGWPGVDAVAVSTGNILT